MLPDCQYLSPGLPAERMDALLVIKDERGARVPLLSYNFPFALIKSKIIYGIILKASVLLVLLPVTLCACIPLKSNFWSIVLIKYLQSLFYLFFLHPGKKDEKYTVSQLPNMN